MVFKQAVSQQNELSEDEIFVLNEDYELRVSLYPKAGYYFEYDGYIYTPGDVDGELVLCLRPSMKAVRP